MNEKLNNISAGIKELETMILLARQQGRPTAGNEHLLNELYMMKCEILNKIESMNTESLLKIVDRRQDVLHEPAMR